MTIRERLAITDLRSTLTAAIWVVGAAVIALAAGLALRYLVFTSTRPWRGTDPLPRTDLILAAVIVALATVVLAGSWLAARRWRGGGLVYGLVVLVAFRLAVVLLLDGRLVSDYAGYFGIAKGMLAGQGFWTSVPPGFPLLEAGAIAVFGRTIQSGELLNLALGAVAGAGIYAITLRHWGDRAAAVALTAFGLMPSQVLFTIVLGTEVAYGAVLVLVALAASRASAAGLTMAAVCGIAIGLSQYIRPTSLAIVPAAALVLYLARRAWRSWLPAALVMTIAFAITVAPIAVWNATTNNRLSVSPSLFDKWTIYIGLNVASHGHYSTAERIKVAAAAGVPTIPGEAGVAGAVFSSGALAKARAFNDAAGVLLEQRIRTNGIRSVTMQPTKFAVMWNRADYPVGLVFGPLTPQPDARAAATAALLAQAAWVALLGAVLFALWRTRRTRPVEGSIILLIVLGAVAVHTLAEVQPRYHEYFVPLLCVLAGAAAAPRPTAPGRDADQANAEAQGVATAPAG